MCLCAIWGIYREGNRLWVLWCLLLTRYDYLYNDSELQAFVEPIKNLLQFAKIVQLFFNNHAKSQATINAKKIEMLLK
jgi:uncharacterized protein YecE (DUF72 family)